MLKKSLLKVMKFIDDEKNSLFPFRISSGHSIYSFKHFPGVMALKNGGKVLKSNKISDY